MNMIVFGVVETDRVDSTKATLNYPVEVWNHVSFVCVLVADRLKDSATTRPLNCQKQKLHDNNTLLLSVCEFSLFPIAIFPYTIGYKASV